MLRLRCDAGHIVPLYLRDEILAAAGHETGTRNVPAEKSAIEFERRVRVGLKRLDPARHAGRISLMLAHDGAFPANMTFGWSCICEVPPLCRLMIGSRELCLEIASQVRETLNGDGGVVLTRFTPQIDACPFALSEANCATWV